MLGVGGGGGGVCGLQLSDCWLNEVAGYCLHLD